MLGAVASRASLPTGTTVNGTNVYASFESGETALSGASGTTSERRTVWWSWSPTVAGVYLLSTLGSSFTTLLGVYDAGSATSFNGLSNVSGAGFCCSGCCIFERPRVVL